MIQMPSHLYGEGAGRSLRAVVRFLGLVCYCADDHRFLHPFVVTLWLLVVLVDYVLLVWQRWLAGRSRDRGKVVVAVPAVLAVHLRAKAACVRYASRPALPRPLFRPRIWQQRVKAVLDRASISFLFRWLPP